MEPVLQTRTVHARSLEPQTPGSYLSLLWRAIGEGKASPMLLSGSIKRIKKLAPSWSRLLDDSASSLKGSKDVPGLLPPPSPLLESLKSGQAELASSVLEPMFLSVGLRMGSWSLKTDG